MNRSTVEIWQYALRASGELADLAQFCGVRADDPGLAQMLRAMVTSGFLKNDGGRRYEAVKRPPDGPMLTTPAGAHPQVSAAAGAPELAPRPAPAGVPFAGEQPGPAGVPGGEQEELPPHLRRNAQGAPEVVDDRTDRIAKAELMESFTPVLDRANQIQEMIDTDEWGNEDPETVLDRLVLQIREQAGKMGYGQVGEVGDVQPYDPELHRYSGVLPATGMPRHVFLTTTGQTFTHRGRRFVFDQAWVDLYDDDIGQFYMCKASDWVDDDDARIYLIVGADDPYKPSNYEGDEDPEFHSVQSVSFSRDVEADCLQAVCSHPKDEAGECDIVRFVLHDADETLLIPSGHIVRTAPIED